MVPAVVCGNKADLDAHRAVTRSDVTEILGEDVPFFEASAKTGTGLQGCFRALASLGGLPNETSPSRHQIVSILTYQSLCVDQRGRRRRRMHLREHAAPCAAVDPLARRPSFTSDLKLVLGSSTKQKKPEKCQIQWIVVSLDKHIVVVCCNVLYVKSYTLAAGWTSALYTCNNRLIKYFFLRDLLPFPSYMSSI